MASHMGHHSGHGQSWAFMPLPGPVAHPARHTLPHGMVGPMNMYQPQQYLAQGLAGWHPYGMPQFNPQFQHQQQAWNFYGAGQQMKRTARTNAVPAKPATRDGAMPTDKPPLMPQKSLVTTANPTQNRTVQVPKPQYGIVPVPRQVSTDVQSLTVPKEASGEVQTRTVQVPKQVLPVIWQGDASPQSCVCLLLATCHFRWPRSPLTIFCMRRCPTTTTLGRWLATGPGTTGL
jgi:hypothetical protein